MSLTRPTSKQLITKVVGFHPGFQDAERSNKCSKSISESVSVTSILRKRSKLENVKP